MDEKIYIQGLDYLYNLALSNTEANYKGKEVAFNLVINNFKQLQQENAELKEKMDKVKLECEYYITDLKRMWDEDEIPYAMEMIWIIRNILERKE